jgi:putative transcriptional regulator
MSNTNTIVTKRQADGSFVEVLPDGGTRPSEDPTQWERARALTDAEVEAAARADPDAQPVTGGSPTRMVPRARTIRRALGLSQEEFATRFHIPLATLRDWEQGRSDPDQTAQAYMRAIAGDAAAVQRALQSGPRQG